MSKLDHFEKLVSSQFDMLKRIYSKRVDFNSNENGCWDWTVQCKDNRYGNVVIKKAQSH